MSVTFVPRLTEKSASMRIGFLPYSNETLLNLMMTSSFGIAMGYPAAGAGSNIKNLPA